MNSPSPQSLDSTQSSSAPTKLPVNDGFDIQKYLQSKDASKMAAWVKSEYSKAKQSRTQRQLQWYTNMAYFYGQQWVEQTGKNYPADLQGKLVMPKPPPPKRQTRKEKYDALEEEVGRGTVAFR